DGKERIAGSRRAAGDRSLLAAQRQGHSVARERLTSALAAQVDFAHVFQRTGGNLSSLDGRGRAARRSSSAAGALHRAAVPRARRDHVADLHRRIAFLRSKGVAGLPERAAPHLTRGGSLAYYLAAWVCGSFFFIIGRYGGLGPADDAGPGRFLGSYFI